MSNVITFKPKCVPERFPDFMLEAEKEYDECQALYVSDHLRLALVVNTGHGPTPLYLILHDGTGRSARCLQIWTSEEWAEIGSDVIVAMGLSVARGLEHAEKLMGQDQQRKLGS
jgi:hypothetical protein